MAAESAGETGAESRADDRAAAHVFVYWDYSCPFCYVGTSRIERLADERPLRVSWRPLEIHTGVPAEGLPVKEAGFAPDRWAEIVDAVERMAREEEVELEVPSFLPRTGPALEAALFAQDLGDDAFGRYHRAVFHAYFARGINIGRTDRLLEVAGEADVDPEALSDALEDERYEDEIRRAREEAASYDVTGTPTFLFGRHKVVGAAPMDVLREAAGRAAADDDAPVGAADGDA